MDGEKNKETTATGIKLLNRCCGFRLVPLVVFLATRDIDKKRQREREREKEKSRDPPRVVRSSKMDRHHSVRTAKFFCGVEEVLLPRAITHTSPYTHNSPLWHYLMLDCGRLVTSIVILFFIFHERSGPSGCPLHLLFPFPLSINSFSEREREREREIVWGREKDAKRDREKAGPRDSRRARLWEYRIENRRRKKRSVV